MKQLLQPSAHYLQAQTKKGAAHRTILMLLKFLAHPKTFLKASTRQFFYPSLSSPAQGSFLARWVSWSPELLDLLGRPPRNPPGDQWPPLTHQLVHTCYEGLLVLWELELRLFARLLCSQKNFHSYRLPDVRNTKPWLTRQYKERTRSWNMRHFQRVCTFGVHGWIMTAMTRLQVSHRKSPRNLWGWRQGKLGGKGRKVRGWDHFEHAMWKWRRVVGGYLRLEY